MLSCDWSSISRACRLLLTSFISVLVVFTVISASATSTLMASLCVGGGDRAKEVKGTEETQTEQEDGGREESKKNKQGEDGDEEEG